MYGPVTLIPWSVSQGPVKKAPKRLRTLVGYQTDLGEIASEGSLCCAARITLQQKGKSVFQFADWAAK